MINYENSISIIPLIVSFSSLIISFFAVIISVVVAKRQRIISIVTNRRVARLENMSELTAKIIALSKPQSIDFYILNNIPYCEKIIKNTKYFIVLLDYRFTKDCELINMAERISKKAQLYYRISKLNEKDYTKKLKSKIGIELSEFERLTAIYFMTEWERLKLEAEKKYIKLSKWLELYQKNEAYIDTKFDKNINRST